MKRHLTIASSFLALTFAGCNAQNKEAKKIDRDLSKVKDIDVLIYTPSGNIQATIYASRTPVTAANFLNLAQRGYYKGTTFHRVVPGFVSQAGKHVSGTASPGYNINNETFTENPKLADLRHDAAGVFSMARTPVKHTNGAQFYITHGPAKSLDGLYTVFGKVTKGLGTAINMKRGTVITKIEIKGDTTELFKVYKDRVDAWNKKLDSQFYNLNPIGQKSKKAQKANKEDKKAEPATK